MSGTPYESPRPESTKESSDLTQDSGSSTSSFESKTLFGHPTGLFTLFFAEMWERFSYYGMRALLVFYMIKGFLGYGDSQAYSVYGAYTALIYMTPFFGGMLADRVLGQRIAIVIGGLLMAAGHLVMTINSEWPFFFALALLIAGNGFFKPNISSLVGALYPKTSGMKDGGFTIFYMGINLGAAMSPLLCGYVGETYGWHYGFGLATAGMLVGLAVFVMPTIVTQFLIFSAAVVSVLGLFIFRPDNAAATAVNIFIALALLSAGIIACVALSRGGLPDKVGRPPGGRVSLASIAVVCLGTALMIPVFALLVSGLAPFTENGEPYQLISSESIEEFTASGGAVAGIAGILLQEVSKPAGLVLTVIGVLSLIYLLFETFRLEWVWRNRMIVALVLIFFQMLFFAFFEQAGSSTNNFTDRNVDRVNESSYVTEDMVGTTIAIQPTQEQLGFTNGDVLFTLTVLDDLRKENEGDPSFEIDWEVSEDDVGMGIATRNAELPASIFQAVNPGFILVFGLVFTALWALLRQKGWDPSAPVKFALGLGQLGLGFGAYWIGAELSTDRGMVAVVWLVLGYLLQTTGELCLSPVGLSAMTKLSPRHLVSTVMGSWFLATAFSQYLAAMISQFTGVTEGGEEAMIPVPSETVHVYGGVFLQICIAALISAAACLALSPILTRMMHQDRADTE